jgi:NAD(P)-dependent dehydrogenase (short-subunit alcohol dehydrogenase family)
MNGPMANKVVVITGATSGIGQAAAERLAGMGARIIQVARDRTRGEAAMKRLRNISPSLAHAIYYADLSKISETKRVGFEVAADEPRIDVLVNNAGAIFSARQITEDHLERTFALNHMAYFVLTRCLLDRLIASAPARIINTASDAHESGLLDFDDLQSLRAYRGGLLEVLRYGGPGYKVYARSKLCNVLFTRQLAKRLDGTQLTVNCFHPGFVATGFANNAGGLISFSMKIAKRFARPAEKGAETLIFLASAPDVSELSGEYLQDCLPVRLHGAALDDAAAQRLWHESNKLAGFIWPD